MLLVEPFTIKRSRLNLLRKVRGRTEIMHHFDERGWGNVKPNNKVRVHVHKME